MGTVTPTQMECMSPVCEDSEGVLSVDMDGAKDLYSQPFSCHPNGRPIPFEHEDQVFPLGPGQNKVSLHVCLHCILHTFPYVNVPSQTSVKGLVW